MSTPIAEQIELAAVAALDGISTAGGYNYDYANIAAGSGIRKLKAIESVNEFPVLFCPPSQEQPYDTGTANVGEEERTLVLSVIGYAKSADQGAQLNKIRQDIERALFAAAPEILGVSGVTDLTLATVEKDQDLEDEAREAVRLVFHVVYRYERGSP